VNVMGSPALALGFVSCDRELDEGG
jgi:hypothetical protein